MSGPARHPLRNREGTAERRQDNSVGQYRHLTAIVIDSSLCGIAGPGGSGGRRRRGMGAEGGVGLEEGGTMGVLEYM